MVPCDTSFSNIQIFEIQANTRSSFLSALQVKIWDTGQPRQRYSQLARARLFPNTFEHYFEVIESTSLPSRILDNRTLWYGLNLSIWPSRVLQKEPRLRGKTMAWGCDWKRLKNLNLKEVLEVIVYFRKSISLDVYEDDIKDLITYNLRR